MELYFILINDADYIFTLSCFFTAACVARNGVDIASSGRGVSHDRAGGVRKSPALYSSPMGAACGYTV